jgi:outer membrane murein-binding lipoprotein Lpp
VRAVRYYAEKFVALALPAFAGFALTGCEDMCDKIEQVRPNIQTLKAQFDQGFSTNTTAGWNSACSQIRIHATQLHDKCNRFLTEIDGEGPDQDRGRRLSRAGKEVALQAISFCNRVTDAAGNPDYGPQLTFFSRNVRQTLESRVITQGSVIWATDCKKTELFAILDPSEGRRRSSRVTGESTPRPSASEIPGLDSHPREGLPAEIAL